MNDVCGYLDGYVQLALVEATHENSRYALQELACRQPHEEELQLQRGYGCDGLDGKGLLLRCVCFCSQTF